MGPYGSQNFKTLLLPEITFESFEPFPEFSSQWSSQKYCFGFLALLNCVSRAHEIETLKFTIVPYG